MKENNSYFKNGDYGQIVDYKIINNNIEFEIKLLNDSVNVNNIKNIIMILKILRLLIIII